MQLNLRVLNYLQNWLRVLAVVVVHQDFARQFLLLRMIDKSIGLLDHPSLVWSERRQSKVNLPQIRTESWLVRSFTLIWRGCSFPVVPHWML